MKRPIYLLLLVSLFFTSCDQDNTSFSERRSDDSVSERNGLVPGHDFRRVGFNYFDHQDGIQYVNATPGIQSIDNEADMIGEHWVYQSPSLQDQEIGFSVIYPTACENARCEVVVFLHGSEGSENSGSALFYDYYKNNQTDKPRVFLFPNGIYAPESPIASGVWKLRNHNGVAFNHPLQLWELIRGITDSDTLLVNMRRNMKDWSVCGFSAGASGAMGVYMDPVFAENRGDQPKHIFPMGGWMEQSLYNYFDFDGGFDLWEDCATSDVDLVIANHMEDDVDCQGFTTYERAGWLLDRLAEEDVPHAFLGLDDAAAPCQPGDDSNPAHSVKFYLNNSIANAEKIVECGSTTWLAAYLEVGDILYQSY